jgi:hypothetical protein
MRIKAARAVRTASPGAATCAEVQAKAPPAANAQSAKDKAVRTIRRIATSAPEKIHETL